VDATSHFPRCSPLPPSPALPATLHRGGGLAAMATSRPAGDRRAGLDARHPSARPSPAGAAVPPPSGGAVHLAAVLRVKTRMLQRTRPRLVRVRCSTLTVGAAAEVPPEADAVGRGGGGERRSSGGGGSSSLAAASDGKAGGGRPAATGPPRGGGSGVRLGGNHSRSMVAGSGVGMGGGGAAAGGLNDVLRINLSGLRVTPMPKKRPLEIDVRLPSGGLLFLYFDDLATFSTWRAALLSAARRVSDVYCMRNATLLGTGDNSRVFAVLPLKGEAAGMRRPVALKEVKKGALSAAQLECETAAMDAYAGLRHPALVPAVDMFDEADRLVTVTPYMAGGSLDKHQAPFAGRAIVALMRSLLQCLVYLHGRGIVHR